MAAVVPLAVAPVVAAPAIAVAAASMPVVTSYALPIADLAQVATTSGLQWVGSDTAKIAAAQASIAAELANAPVHVPRERPPAVVVEATSLVLVETKRDLREMPLPFEKPTA
jgi:ribonuclease E